MTQGRRCRGTSWLRWAQEASRNSAQLRAHGDLAAGGAGMVVEELMLGPARVSQDGGTQQVGTRAAEQGAAAETQGEPPAKGLSQGRCVPPGGFSPTPPQKPAQRAGLGARGARGPSSEAPPAALGEAGNWEEPREDAGKANAGLGG